MDWTDLTGVRLESGGVHMDSEGDCKVLGPDKGPEEEKTSNGQFEPSWIWLIT